MEGNDNLFIYILLYLVFISIQASAM